MAQIPQETIQQVLAATHIEELIQSYIPIRRAGSGYKALCPFHGEKTPSFTITPARQTFHCFGCGKGGDAIAFVREMDNLTFTDAVRKLAGRVGIPVIEVESDPHADQARRTRGRLLDVMRETTAFLHSLVLESPDAQHARDYLKSRGFTREAAERWAIGWMPENPEAFLNWARNRKFTGRELVESGMAAPRDDGNPRAGLYVRFRNRLMFPIRNEMGDVIGFSGRQLVADERSGKYVNSPETPLFRKSNILFALDRAKKPILREKAALLCEGQIDVIACHEHGIDQAIATQGTAMTQQHARLLKRYTKSVVLCYDADNAGVTAAEKAFKELVGEGMEARVVELPHGEDPDTFLRTHGADAFRQLIANAREFFDFKLDRASAAGLLANANGRATLANECANLLAAMTDHAMRDAQLLHVATRLQIGISAMKEATVKAARQSPNRADKKETVQVMEATPVDTTVAVLCQLALESATAQHFLSEQFESLHEAGEFVAGIPLLEQILSAHPDPADHSAVNAFLGRLPEEDRLALNKLLHTDHRHDDPLAAAYETMSKLAAKVLVQRDARIKAALAEPGLSGDRLRELLEEGKEIQSMIQGIGERFLVEEILPPRAPKVPAKKVWKRLEEK